MFQRVQPEKTADIWRRYHWFPRQITSEKRAQKFHTYDASLPRADALSVCGETSGSVAKCRLFSQAMKTITYANFGGVHYGGFEHSQSRHLKCEVQHSLIKSPHNRRYSVKREERSLIIRFPYNYLVNSYQDLTEKRLCHFKFLPPLKGLCHAGYRSFRYKVVSIQVASLQVNSFEV